MPCTALVECFKALKIFFKITKVAFSCQSGRFFAAVGFYQSSFTGGLMRVCSVTSIYYNPVL